MPSSTSDPSLHEVIKSIPILDISFSAVHPKDSKLVMWITNDARLDLMYCHAFHVKKAKGEEVLQTMALAFTNAKRRLEASQGDEEALREMGITSGRKTQSNALGVFEAKFIGSVPAADVTGSEVAEQAVVDAKQLNRHPEGVIMIISSEGIRTIEGLTGEVVTSVLITDVSFVTTSGAKRDVLAFISKDTRLKRITCHVFECRRAQEISTTIGKAFAKAKEEQDQRAGNPFAPTSTEREAVQGPLFKYQIHRKDLVADKPIGAGQFGQVYRAKYKHQKVAVKTVRQSASAQDKDEFMDEAVVMVELSNPNLVGILGVSLQQKPWLCVIEYMEYGDLRDVLQTCEEKKFPLRESEQIHFAKQIASGLAFMASLRYIHMDIAARNCLLTYNNVVKVADFGLTRKLDEGKDTYTLRKSAKLPVRWMAVETMTKKLFSEASDVWAFGVLLWEILSYGELPYKEIKNKDVQKAIVKEGTRLQKPASAPDPLFRVAETCWRTDRLKRYAFAELKQQLETLHGEAVRKDPDVRDIGACISSL
ncbi:TK/HMTK protein kinase [Salpingoeca rosetta]|uniref:TK/HMTK protein kinase n=1 Tax=Salpingoeca rosetta (strain ATCC 50818 / BSB-021) TaxID=946362 RepID=F2UE61_SALR5|nr:TK/HMTK protein kinase [Salpingoeca rosetta]EGD74911.1 TK/HMTK protein kinase [Salpingoeca rosetta]|eukprot:XP_004992556.1 TK/HMTK protein kinase [Salpingoeca rosetta]